MRERFADLSIQHKLLVLILPLVVIPVLVLGAVGFVTASREAAKASARYLVQRESDLRMLAENTAIRDFFFNRFYGLDDEATVYRAEIERWLLRFAERANAAEQIYETVRYVDPDGVEIAVVKDGGLAAPGESIRDEPFFDALGTLPPGAIFASPVAERMTYAIPVREALGDGSEVLLGGIVLDFLYPRDDFRWITIVIAVTFIATACGGLGIAVPLLVTEVRRLTRPLRRLSDAADRVAAGDRSISVDIHTRDEIGRLADSFNKMTTSLAEQEESLRRRLAENQALYEIGREITARIALEPTLELIVRRARELLRGDVSLLALQDEGGEEYVIRARSGEDLAPLRNLRFRSGQGLGGRIVQSGQALLVNDYLAEFAGGPFIAPMREAGLRAIVAVPLKAHDRIIGVLYVVGRMPGRFTQDDLDLLNALASQATISIENAALYAQVRRHAEELEHKVVERTQELKETNRKLQEVSSHKSKFLANMSHELRTPLNAIIGFTRLVMRKGKETLPQRQYDNLHKILVSAEHLLGLINDILDLSKIESGRVEVRPERVELPPLVEACLRTVEPMLRSDRVRLACDLPADLPPPCTDRDKLRQILINLLSNAVKFTDAGTVTLRVRREGAALAIAVADTGIGIPPDNLELIFEEFQQVDDSTTRQYGGTGLGLSISRRLAQLLGGGLSVSSEPSVGSTFTLTIPLDLDPLAGLEPRPVPAEIEAAREGPRGRGRPGTGGGSR